MRRLQLLFATIARLGSVEAVRMGPSIVRARQQLQGAREVKPDRNMSHNMETLQTESLTGAGCQIRQAYLQ